MRRKESLENAKTKAGLIRNDKDFLERQFEKFESIARENPAYAYRLGAEVVKDITYGKAQIVEYAVKSSPVLKKYYKRWQKGKIQAEEFSVSTDAIEKMKYNQVSQAIDTAWAVSVLAGLGVVISGVVLKVLGAQDPLTLPIIGSGVATAVLGGLIALPDIKTERVNGKKKEKSRIATAISKRFAKKYEAIQIDEEPLRIYKEKIDSFIAPYLEKEKRDKKGITIEDLKKEAHDIMLEIDKTEEGINKLTEELNGLTEESVNYEEKKNIKEALIGLHHQLGEKLGKTNDAIAFENECQAKGFTIADNFALCIELKKLKAQHESDMAEIEKTYKRAVDKEVVEENE